MCKDDKKVVEKVYIKDISPETLAQEIRNGLDFIDFKKIFPRDSSIFIKPNLTDRAHKPGVTTTPLFIKTVIEELSPLVERVFVGESDGGNYSFSADTSLENHGIFEVAERFENVDVVNLSKLPTTRVSRHVCGKDVWVDLPDLLLTEIGGVVSVPVFKAHAMTIGSFSIKNLWGCYSDPMRLLFHKNLDYKLALINQVLKNRVQIIDGFWALDGHGPMEGTPLATNKVLVADNPVAADSTAAYLMNLDASKIGHIRMAEQFGLGTSDLTRMQFNVPVEAERLAKLKPYKITLDKFNALTWHSETLGRIVYASPLTPFIYRFINAFRPRDERTFWAERNKTQVR